MTNAQISAEAVRKPVAFPTALPGSTERLQALLASLQGKN